MGFASRCPLPLIDGQVPIEEGWRMWRGRTLGISRHFGPKWDPDDESLFCFCQVVQLFQSLWPACRCTLWEVQYGFDALYCHQMIWLCADQGFWSLGCVNTRNHQSMMVDLHGEDRGSGTVAGTLHGSAQGTLYRRNSGTNKLWHSFAIEYWHKNATTCLLPKFSSNPDRAPMLAGWIVANFSRGRKPTKQQGGQHNWRKRCPNSLSSCWRVASGMKGPWYPMAASNPVEANIASPEKRWSAQNSGKTEWPRLVNVGLEWSKVFSFNPCAAPSV